MNAVADITGTLRTTTCGHNPQSNGEIESWWRYWNRAMRYLSPSQYLTWPVYAQRIVFAYNSVPHDSIGNFSPHEMDFASPLQSPFGPPAPDITFPDLEDPPAHNTTTVSPADFVLALRTSVQAFHAFAASHKTFNAPSSPFHLAKVTRITEALLSLHYLGTTAPALDSAIFRLLWLAPTPER